MSRKASNYWERRSTDLMLRLEKDTKYTINELIEVYNQATNNINKEIQNIFNNFGKDDVLTSKELKKLLNKKETKEFYDNLLDTINTISDDEQKMKLLARYNAPAYAYRISRLQAMQNKIDIEMKKIGDVENKITRLRYVDTIQNEYYRTIYDIQKGTGIGFEFSGINMRTMNLMLSDDWIDGRNYSKRIWKNVEKLGNYLKYNMSASALTGKSISKISQELSDYMQVGIYNATTLVRTEVNHFANETDMLVYEECGIDKYQFIATLDMRTCEHCGNLDKKIFKLVDKKPGVNFPPIHPNDRCTTIAYFDDEDMSNLKRRARDNETGQNETIKDISYNEWLKQHEDVMTNEQKYDTISLDNLPEKYKTRKEIDSTNIAINYINKNGDSRMIQLFNDMGNTVNIPFDISHASKHMVSIRTNYRDSINSVKITIPKLENEDVGKINIWVHENMHLIDFMKENDNMDKYNGYYSTKSIGLRTIMQTTNNRNFGEEVKDIFEEFNQKYTESKKQIISKYNFGAINKEYTDRKLSYKEYLKKYKSQAKLYHEEIDSTGRNIMGGGVDILQDIYDALSGGEYRTNKTVIYGHGKKEYRNVNTRIKETVANYGTLLSTRPDLAEVLKRDKPQLVQELDNIIEGIIKKKG